MQIGLIVHAYLFNPHVFRRHGTTKINRMIRILRRFPEAVPRLDLEGILHAPFGDRVRVVSHRIFDALIGVALVGNTCDRHQRNDAHEDEDALRSTTHRD